MLFEGVSQSDEAYSLMSLKIFLPGYGLLNILVGYYEIVEPAKRRVKFSKDNDEENDRIVMTARMELKKHRLKRSY